MEKAIDIKRRAQRCIQNGDLEGALTEYEKLVGGEESDPYNFVLLADLLYKKGDQTGAAERYLSAVAAYEKSSLFKNAIAVCKKMLRLSLSPAKVLNSLAQLHLLDGLAGEAALYYVQYAEHMVRSSAPAEAAEALRKAFDACQDNLKVLEQLSEAWLLAGENPRAAAVMLEAAAHYRSRNQESDAVRCTLRASQLDPTVTSPSIAVPEGDAAVAAEASVAPAAAVPFLEPGQTPRLPSVLEIEPRAAAPEVPPASGTLEVEHTARGTSSADVTAHGAPEGFDSGRHGFEFGATASRTETPEPESASSPDDFAVTESEVSATFGAISLSGAELSTPEPLRLKEDDAPVVDLDAVETEAVDAIGDAGDAPSVYEIGAEEAEPAGVYEIDADESIEAAVESVYEIAAEDAEPAIAAEAGAPVQPVYEITIDETPIAAAAPVEREVEEPVYEISEDAEPVMLETPEKPGLAFTTSESAPSVHTPTPLEHVEALLTLAQDQFRSGDRDLATGTLAEAARAYESLGRLDSAATIYRSLGRGAQATPVLMEAWLANCERRGDAQEAAQVSCELGDRALNDGDEATALGWFERALRFDASNEMARRRVQRLSGAPGGTPEGGVVVASATPASEQAPSATANSAAGTPPMESGRVEVAVGRAEAVSFDLAGLLSEFQKGVAAQLAGDSQSHYDLGMTYREMGLLDQAIESFRVAQDDPRLAPRALEMAGRCLADQGRHHEACGDFRRALGLLDSAEGTDGEVRWHLAHSLTEIGEHEDALTEYERVEASLPGYEDVAERIVALRRVLGRS
ncbi:MAG: hypothetical protein HZA61_09035 [Candidatus Eisenbacteria bacterium]|uniref:Tetratricopeptide repeat protein n=1 Tax=Eiseniibacteriota bacterium TaxID=2212470 RepID=A0A933W375_UNCEI|nr:hypothetical protein [Candidatus Eisenbacteria bacterium]